jgi:hypothetical protein
LSLAAERIEQRIEYGKHHGQRLHTVDPGNLGLVAVISRPFYFELDFERLVPVARMRATDPDGDVFVHLRTGRPERHSSLCNGVAGEPRGDEPVLDEAQQARQEEADRYVAEMIYKGATVTATIRLPSGDIVDGIARATLSALSGPIPSLPETLELPARGWGWGSPSSIRSRSSSIS